MTVKKPSANSPTCVCRRTSAAVSGSRCCCCGAHYSSDWCTAKVEELICDQFVWQRALMQQNLVDAGEEFFTRRRRLRDSICLKSSFTNFCKCTVTRKFTPMSMHPPVNNTRGSAGLPSATLPPIQKWRRASVLDPVILYGQGMTQVLDSYWWSAELDSSPNNKTARGRQSASFGEWLKDDITNAKRVISGFSVETLKNVLLTQRDWNTTQCQPQPSNTPVNTATSPKATIGRATPIFVIWRMFYTNLLSAAFYDNDTPSIWLLPVVLSGLLKRGKPKDDLN
ncbi:hypothetical protein B0H19DRAFT_1079426 [Mycena capillaripes]|nr:hypothetical protein B0H19DRAFT_1079426 [Mycena capillaripes]